MIKPIGINKQHEAILSNYLLVVCESMKELSTESRYNNFLDIVDIIVKYHNEYSNDKLGAYSDFMSIIPTNVTSCFSGYIAGVETKRNRALCRAYRTLLTELSHNIINDMEKLKLDKD
tara:strand:- start:305 stop:658 length:354 start_codon:yes stop_codon:yes gene_type:complete